MGDSRRNELESITAILETVRSLDQSRTATRACKAYQIWKTNPNAPGLRLKRVSEQEPIYSVRVGDACRVLGLLEGDTIVWFWIGRHDEYERILNK